MNPQPPPRSLFLPPALLGSLLFETLFPSVNVGGAWSLLIMNRVLGVPVGTPDSRDETDADAHALTGEDGDSAGLPTCRICLERESPQIFDTFRSPDDPPPGTPLPFLPALYNVLFSVLRCVITLSLAPRIEDQDELFSPCNCSGTQGWVHRSCLDKWRAHQLARGADDALPVVDLGALDDEDWVAGGLNERNVEVERHTTDRCSTCGHALKVERIYKLEILRNSVARLALLLTLLTIILFPLSLLSRIHFTILREIFLRDTFPSTPSLWPDFSTPHLSFHYPPWCTTPLCHTTDLLMYGIWGLGVAANWANGVFVWESVRRFWREDLALWEDARADPHPLGPQEPQLIKLISQCVYWGTSLYWLVFYFYFMTPSGSTDEHVSFSGHDLLMGDGWGVKAVPLVLGLVPNLIWAYLALSRTAYVERVVGFVESTTSHGVTS